MVILFPRLLAFAMERQAIALLILIVVHGSVTISFRGGNGVVVFILIIDDAGFTGTRRSSSGTFVVAASRAISLVSVFRGRGTVLVTFIVDELCRLVFTDWFALAGELPLLLLAGPLFVG